MLWQISLLISLNLWQQYMSFVAYLQDFAVSKCACKAAVGIQD